MIRWGIVGCGNVTEVKSGPAYQNTEGFELKAVMRRDVAKAEDYAKRHQVPKFYGDAEALINDPDIDAIYIATPPNSHEDYALKVAEAGKICCIEKPMAPNYEACVRINAAFEKKNLPLFVAYYRRSLPRFDQIKTWIDAGEIGDIRHINWNLTKPPSNVDLAEGYNWRTDKSIARGGYYDDLASHGLDLFVYLLGPVSEANGIGVNQQKLYSAMDAVTGYWLHEAKITGSGSWNFGAEEHQDKVEIFGTKGTISFAVFEEENIILRTGDQEESLWIPNPKHVQKYHVQNMAAHLNKEKTHPSTGKTAVHTAWIMESMLNRMN
ncbi:Gfo/Idh/MocA family protein [Subsaximicrobium wynnwilliamsii]|nr:Gfo/Idh/MocA family oxidoreductase [Subsaximicrobium wynnwilliamsii]